MPESKWWQINRMLCWIFLVRLTRKFFFWSGSPEKLFFWSLEFFSGASPGKMKKNPTKHPVDLPPLTLRHLKNFQVSIFEFPEPTRGWKPEVKVLDPYGVSHFKFSVSILS